MHTPSRQPEDIAPGWTTDPEHSDAAPPQREGEGPFRDATRGPRLQKVMAAAGVASRRACEALIEEGAVRVNGLQIKGLPAWVNPAVDTITVHGQRVRTGAPPVCVMLYKPRGFVCTASDPEGRRRAVDLVAHPTKVRLFSVGRLDMDSSGLLLLTNDGGLSHLLTHPSNHVPRVYDITVNGEVDAAMVRRLERGINLPDDRTGRPRPARFESVRILRAQRDRTKLRVVLTEGRNRQIRRMMLALDHPVRKLRRIAIGPLKLEDLRPGQWRDLTERELEHLRRDASKPGKKKGKRPNRKPRR
ncbi:MAG: pseudouridine synthase [Phycisphaerales bacterium]|jgi:pseudouridine synthase|nr:pseudouridine synthase [Phycisphaerales bacterium]